MDNNNRIRYADNIGQQLIESAVITFNDNPPRKEWVDMWNQLKPSKEKEEQYKNLIK